MFRFFLEEYKEKIYKSDYGEKLSKLEWALMVLTMILIGAEVVFGLGGKLWAMFGSALLAVIPSAVACKINSDRMRKIRDSRIKKYKKARQQKLLALLEDERFQLDSPEKIQWMISSCDASLERGEKPFRDLSDSFSGIVFPCVMLLVGVLVERISSENAILLIVVFFMLWLTFVVLKMLLSPVIDAVILPNKSVLLALKSELEYMALLTAADREELASIE